VTQIQDLSPYGLELIIAPRPKDLGGFFVRRALPFIRKRHIGPWVFFDHMGPSVFSSGIGINVRPHPHIGLATVTYLFEGAIRHRDSLGTDCLIKPGDLNLMVAGRGIVHSERDADDDINRDRPLHGLQLWHGLPDAFEDIEPDFYHYPATAMPTVLVEGVAVKLMMGTAYGVSSPVKTFTDTLYLEANLKLGQTLTLPDTVTEAALYVVEGQISLGRTALGARYSLTEGCMAVYRPQDSVTIEAKSDTRIVVIGGAALGERHIYWNFVSSSQARIETARTDWQTRKAAGSVRFPVVPSDDIEFIPLPENS
jgi:redox-sensitive bicupin YhaK (pirin superfamily)